MPKRKILMLNLRNAFKGISDGPKIPLKEFFGYEFPPLGGGASPVSYEIKKSLSLFIGLLDA